MVYVVCNNGSDQQLNCYAQEWAVAETRQKNFSEARKLFTKALALNPRHIPAIGGLAHAEFQAGELHCARNLYARALQVADLRPDTHADWLSNRSTHLSWRTMDWL